ncbi:MAG: ADP-ribosylglycohydrolase family protein [Saccharofermentanales bacterium]
MKNSLLYKKVYGALIGSAIGDAMGGPVEFWNRHSIAERFGTVCRLMDYGDVTPDIHGPWSREAGTYTDDSRMSKILCGAVISAGGAPLPEDVRKAFIEYYHNASTDLARGFIEEYYYKAIYGERKQIFGGYPTNAGVMGIAPLGVISPCDPVKAFAEAYDAIFFVEGYARYSAALCAAAISAAMRHDATYKTVIEDALDAISRHKSRREGPIWQSHGMYEHIGKKNENLIRDVCALAERYGDVRSICEELEPIIEHPFGADGAESMAIGFAMFTAAKGDFVQTVEGCVNFGRDNDSSASFGGALAGALNGVDRIPAEWIDLVEKVNPGPGYAQLASEICRIIQREQHSRSAVTQKVENLLDHAEI